MCRVLAAACAPACPLSRRSRNPLEGPRSGARHEQYPWHCESRHSARDTVMAAQRKAHTNMCQLYTKYAYVQTLREGIL